MITNINDTQQLRILNTDTIVFVEWMMTFQLNEIGNQPNYLEDLCAINAKWMSQWLLIVNLS